ncbi:Trk-type K+ transport system, membrane component [Salinisphaera dokdonensis CL-ES53]|uniref:Trk-type K+ transport system, membrane component n=2 Tax=Salinisphaera TaxID=180541 RepID=A0ABV2B2W4_9GAMM
MRPVARGVGLLLHVPALMGVASIPICLVFDEMAGARVLLITIGLSTVIAQVLYWPARRGTQVFRRHAMLIAAISWLLIACLGAVPFAIGGGIKWLDAAFESLSGFTGTGLSVLEPSTLPHYLQWWRSLSQWIGGVGVIVLLLSILPPRRGALELYYSETRDQKILPSVRATARVIWSVYCSYTLVAVGLLWLAGEPLWRALNHGMTGIATGGFTITDDSFQSASLAVKLVSLLIMTAGAISFFVHYRAIQVKPRAKALFAGAEQRLFWTVLCGGALLLTLDNHALGQSGWVDSVFQWVSAVTTTGFQSAALSNWHTGPLLMLCLVMLVGATAGSTGGGLKMLRFVLLYKSVRWSLQTFTRRPHEVLRLTFDGQALTREDAASRTRAVTTLSIAWMTVSLLAVIIMTHCVADGVPLQAVVFDVVSAQSNVGLSSGLVDTDLSASGKLLLMAVMWAGRLEIVPVLVLVALLVRGRTPSVSG